MPSMEADCVTSISQYRAERNLADRQSVACIDLCILASQNRVADLYRLRPQDVALLTICIVQQADTR